MNTAVENKEAPVIKCSCDSNSGCTVINQPRSFWDFMMAILGVALLAVDIGGIVLAKGFWLTAFSICFPPYAFYLVVAKIMSGFLGVI
jgi:hypothetical protein